MANKLNQNDDLVVIKTLTSLDGRFKLSMQTDGNLVLYGPEGDAIWWSDTYGKTVSSAIMQSDGNFVLYAPGSVPVWSSGTYGNPGALLCVQNDGNIVINNAAGNPIWSIPPAFIDTKNLVTKLIRLKSMDPTKKIAFVFSGGGARAAWFGGILEAFEKEVRRQQPNVPADQRFAPDMLVGTSGGGLAAVGYFADLMNSKQYGPYANRQSWLWREIARDNAAAFKLLDNPGVLELLSGSRTGKGQMDWSMIKDKPLSNFLTIANIPNLESPTFNFNRLFSSVKEIKQDINTLETNWKKVNAALEKLYADSGMIISKINIQNLSAPWIQSLNIATGNIGKVQYLANKVWDDIDYIQKKITITKLTNPPTPSNILDAFNRSKSLIRDSGAVVVGVIDGLSDLNNHLMNIPINNLKKQFSDLEKIFTDIKKVLDALLELQKATSHTIGDGIKGLYQLSTIIGDVIGFTIAIGKMIQSNSSLMNTTGLKNAMHEVLRMATPEKFVGNGLASQMDKGIFEYWQTQRTAKLANPLVRAPELILTAGNITANRLTLLALCDIDSAKKLADLKRWVIGLDLESSGLIHGKKMMRSKLAQTSNINAAENWIFGAWPNDFIPPLSNDADLDILNATEVALNNQADITPKSRIGVAIPADCPFEHLPGQSSILGTSILAGAALTTASIPIAFPPRLWRFENQFLEKIYFHWFVDGGICDNRPIEHAIDAGADYVVSFELTPLRKAITDIPVSSKRPNLLGMISASLIDTPIDSAFKRYIESYVANNPPIPGKSPQKRIWRIAPEAGAGEEDETIGVYDFNGYWDKGEMKMGLFDWFMRGYLDGSKSLSSAVPGPDAVLDAYNTMSDYGQKKNAAQEKATPGYFEVDFYNNKPHPGYP
ncbi:MAG: patatin-like phospholipase family protein [Saprospiraceae bacterium]